MKLKIKFTSAAFAMTLLTMAGTAEAAFLSSTAWLDIASLTWETIFSGDAQLIWGSENHNVESLAGDFGGTLSNREPKRLNSRVDSSGIQWFGNRLCRCLFQRNPGADQRDRFWYRHSYRYTGAELQHQWFWKRLA